MGHEIAFFSNYLHILKEEELRYDIIPSLKSFDRHRANIAFASAKFEL